MQRRRVVRGEYLFIWTESGLPLTGRAPPYEGKKLMMSAQGGWRDNFAMGFIFVNKLYYKLLDLLIKRGNNNIIITNM